MLDIQKKLTNTFYALLSLPATAMGFALSIQISALSWILSTKYNLDIHEVGIVWAAGPLAGIIGQPLIGLISDNVWFWNGRRKPFIIIGGTIAALMLLCLPSLDTIGNLLDIGSLIVIAVGVALTLDLAINISFNPTRSIIADVTDDGEARTKGFTWMQSISGFFGVMAYIIGAIFGKYYLIYFGVFLVLAFSILPVFFIEEPRSLAPPEETDGAEEEDTSEQGQLWRIYFAHGFTWLGVQTMFVYIFAYISQKMGTLSDDDVGFTIDISFAVMNIVGFLLPVFALQPIAKKIGPVRTHTLCIAAMAVAYFAIVVIGKNPMSLYFLMVFVGIGWAATVSLPFAIFSEKVSKARMGYYMGIFNLSVVIPQLIVSLVLGSVINMIPDKNSIFIISGASLAISAVLWTLVRESDSYILAAEPGGAGH